MGPEPEAAGKAVGRHTFIGVGEPPEGLAKTIQGGIDSDAPQRQSKASALRQFVSSLLMVICT
jgi:hypothetical protein